MTESSRDRVFQVKVGIGWMTCAPMELDSVSRTDDGLRRGRLKLISGRNEWQLASQQGMPRRNLTGLALSTLPFTVRPSKPGQTLALQRVKHGRTGVTRT
jgi:hypothetical protein